MRYACTDNAQAMVDARVDYWQQRTSAHRGVVTWAPTIDPERLKLLSQDMVQEQGVRLVYHAWGADPIVNDGAVTGVMFSESLIRVRSRPWKMSSR